MKSIFRLSIPVVLVVALAGCHQGPNASTTTQDETGNGIAMVAGELQMESVTIVAGKQGKLGALSAVVVNTGSAADRLDSIFIGDKPARLDPDGIEIGPQSSVAIATGRELSAQAPLGSAKPGEFVEVTFQFANSGSATEQVLIVPPVGYYETVAPKAPTASPQE